MIPQTKPNCMQGLPSTAQPYISASLANALTISGPPAVLREFCSFERSKGVPATAIQIYAPFHRASLYSNADIDHILNAVDAGILQQVTATLPVISSTSGRLIEANDLHSHLREALFQILIEPIGWNEFCAGLACFILSTKNLHIEIRPIGTTAGSSLSTSLKQMLTAGHEVTCTVPGPLHGNGFFPGGALSADINRAKIAIIGVSGRYPGAENNEQFWEVIRQGRDTHKEVPPTRWDARTHCDPTGKVKNTSITPYGCWLENPGLFDARFFNMSPRETPQVDPAQRMGLMAAYEAMEQAGIVPDATPSTRKERVGVVFGATSNDWMETNSAQDIDTYYIPGGNRAFIPGRINYFFKFSGQSYSVDTACSSSLAAIHIACNALWRGDVDMVIAGGTNVLTNPDPTAGLDRGHFLSRTGNCKTFDDQADGYCRAEGIATILLKRLEDAVIDHDPIRGLILGAYTNHSAEAESITRPHVGAQRNIFHKILSSAGVDPYTVSYVEMHGTGTQAGDAGEMASVLDIFAPPDARKRRRDDQPLYLGSAKSNIGHGEAASGVTSVSKVLLMMQNNIIPPHCGIKNRINRKFPTDLKARNVHIATKEVPWHRTQNEPRRVFVNNFSAAGGNSAILMEDAPLEKPLEGIDPRTSHIIATSAKCAASLAGNLKSILGYIRSNSNISLAQLSYTTTARRIHHHHRVMVSGSNLVEIETKLEQALNRGDGSTRPKAIPRMMFSYTGQGSTFVGMASHLYQHLVGFRTNIERFDKLGQALGFPIVEPIFQDAPGTDLSEFSPTAVQLAHIYMQMALTQLWASWGIVPDVVVGHSLGEYAALNAAEVLSDADTIFLVGKRAQLLEQHCALGTHSMLVVQASNSKLPVLLAGHQYEVSCFNGPEETVLGGTSEQICVFKEVLQQRAVKTTLIRVPYAYHSSQVEAVLDEFEHASKAVTFHKPRISVLSSSLARSIDDEGTFDSQYLRRHCREPVNYLGAMIFAEEHQVVPERSCAIEIGPHPVLTGLTKAIRGSQVTALPTLQRRQEDWKVLAQTLSTLYCAGKDIHWSEYHRDFPSSHKVLQLPAYSWDLKDYWIQYVHDWSLRKGDPPLMAPSVTPLSSTTIHRVLEDSIDKVTVECDISRDDLYPLVQGHEVDGVPLCTPVRNPPVCMVIFKIDVQTDYG